MNVREKARLLAGSLEAGRPDPELSRAPDVEALYNLGQQLRQVERPEPDPVALAAGVARVRRALAAARPASVGRPRRLARLAWAALALFLALVVTTTGTVLAAESSLPGELLYPIKRAGEEVHLALTWRAQSRAALRIDLAERRLAEVAAVCAGGECPADLLADMGAQTEAAQEATEQLPAGKHAALLDRMVALTARQGQVLQQVLAAAPDAARPGLEQALERSRHGHERAREALEKEKEQGREREKEKPPAAPADPPKPTKKPHGPPQTPPGKGPQQP